MEGRGPQGMALPPIGSMRSDVKIEQDAAHPSRPSDLPALDTSTGANPHYSPQYQASPPNQQYYHPTNPVSANATKSQVHPSDPITRRHSGDRPEPHTAPAADSRYSLPSLYEALGMDRTSPRASNDKLSTPTLTQSSHLSDTTSHSSKVPQNSGYTPHTRDDGSAWTTPRPSYVARMGPGSPAPKAATAQGTSSPVSPRQTHQDVNIQPQQPQPYNLNGGSVLSQEQRSFPNGPQESPSIQQPNGTISPEHHAKSIHHHTPRVQPRLMGDSSRPTGIRKPSKHSYGDSVKRHLEVFDLEQALNGVYDGSKQLLEFSNFYRQKAHQTQRSGPLPGSTPHIQEIDEMMENVSNINDSLNCIREVVVTQQAALAERSREHALKATYQAPDEGAGFQDDAKDRGFPGSEAKRRRGRAAPPGRCHSCNRAETPEWRRGPDGARTLCNACGLHYAKLTRKMGAVKSSTSSSNLRPKTEDNATAVS